MELTDEERNRIFKETRERERLAKIERKRAKKKARGIGKNGLKIRGNR